MRARFRQKTVFLCSLAGLLVMRASCVAMQSPALQLTLASDKVLYLQSEVPQLTLTIKNTGSARTEVLPFYGAISKILVSFSDSTDSRAKKLGAFPLRSTTPLTCFTDPALQDAATNLVALDPGASVSFDYSDIELDAGGSYANATGYRATVTDPLILAALTPTAPLYCDVRFFFLDKPGRYDIQMIYQLQGDGGISDLMTKRLKSNVLTFDIH